MVSGLFVEDVVIELSKVVVHVFGTGVFQMFVIEELTAVGHEPYRIDRELAVSDVDENHVLLPMLGFELLNPGI